MIANRNLVSSYILYKLYILEKQELVFPGSIKKRVKVRSQRNVLQNDCKKFFLNVADFVVYIEIYKLVCKQSCFLVPELKETIQMHCLQTRWLI